MLILRRKLAYERRVVGSDLGHIAVDAAAVFRVPIADGRCWGRQGKRNEGKGPDQIDHSESLSLRDCAWCGEGLEKKGKERLKHAQRDEQLPT